MICSFLLNSMKLLTPTIKEGKAKETDKEHQVFISQEPIEVVCFERYIIDVGGEKVPFTISLMGCKDTYLGIKATAYFKSTLKEEGVFFKIHST